MHAKGSEGWNEVCHSPIQLIQIVDVCLIDVSLVVDFGDKRAAGSILFFLQRVMPIRRLHQIVLHPSEETKSVRSMEHVQPNQPSIGHVPLVGESIQQDSKAFARFVA